MTAQQELDALMDARSLVVRVRSKVQFDLPLADAKLIRVTRHIETQRDEAERKVWEEAGLLAPEEPVSA